jgi:hypothetical protein
VQNGGTDLYVANNGWKYISFPYTVTSSTVLEFEFRSTIEGEIHGIAFDNDNGISSNLTFKVHGTQNWGYTNYDNYSGTAWVSYVIPVGNFYTGTFDRLSFVADHDGGSRNGNAYFRNVKVYEGSCGSLASPVNIFEIIPELGTESERVISVYPNPFSDLVNLDLPELDGEVNVEIYNAMGKKVWQQASVKAGGRTSIRPSIAQGMYVLRVSQGDFRKEVKLVRSK